MKVGSSLRACRRASARRLAPARKTPAKTPAASPQAWPHIGAISRVCLHSDSGDSAGQSHLRPLLCRTRGMRRPGFTAEARRPRRKRGVSFGIAGTPVPPTAASSLLPHQFHAAVLRAALWSVVGIHGLGGAQAGGGQTPRIHAELRDQDRFHRLRAAARKVRVVVGVAGGIRVPFDAQLQVGLVSSPRAMDLITAADSGFRRSLSVSKECRA